MTKEERDLMRKSVAGLGYYDKVRSLIDQIDSLEAERDAVAAKADGRIAAFLSLLEDRAKELVPNYPYSMHDAFEWLWAIASSLEGTRLANDDWASEAHAAVRAGERCAINNELVDVGLVLMSLLTATLDDGDFLEGIRHKMREVEQRDQKRRDTEKLT